jgi:hypothetical protein
MELDAPFSTTEEFWERAAQNLRDGRVRLLFISDEISASLRRIVEFLNEEMQHTEVLAAEVKQFVSTDGKQLLQTSLVGQTERAREVKGLPRHPAALTALVEGEHLKEGATLWLVRERLPVSLRPSSPSDPRLMTTLTLENGQPRLFYQPPGAQHAEELTPSKATDRIRREFDPTYTTVRARAVNDAFSTEPGGLSLGELALQHGVWVSSDNQT